MSTTHPRRHTGERRYPLLARPDGPDVHAVRDAVDPGVRRDDMGKRDAR
jgi:hypothetical protein